MIRQSIPIRFSNLPFFVWVSFYVIHKSQLPDYPDIFQFMGILEILFIDTRIMNKYKSEVNLKWFYHFSLHFSIIIFLNAWLWLKIWSNWHYYLLPYAEIGASFNNSCFGLLLWGGLFLLFWFWVLMYSKYCEQMIIDFHQLSHYYNITYYLLLIN